VALTNLFPEFISLLVLLILVAYMRITGSIVDIGYALER
jgi:hypothetical protein